MIRSILRRASYANVAATLALFAALATGGAFAASKINSKDIAKNAVLSKHVKNGQVKAGDLAKPERFHIVDGTGEPQFLSGGEGDCFWQNLNEILPDDLFDPVAFYKDPYGVVHLTGPAIASDGPGGDGLCDDTEDAFIFTLPNAYRPARSHTYSLIGSEGPGGQILITGKEGLDLGGGSIPPGVVASVGGTEDGTQIAMDGVTFRAAGKSTGIANAGQAAARPARAADRAPLGIDLDG